MDKTNYPHRLDTPRFFNTQKEDSGAVVKHPFHFRFNSLVQKAAVPEGKFPPANANFHRANANFGDAPKSAESTPARAFNDVLRPLPFESSGLHRSRLIGPAYINLANGGEEDWKTSCAPFHTDIQENTLSGLDKHPNEYASSLPSPHGNQGISKREESVDISLREVPDSEDPLVTISTKYRQVQRETEKQRNYIVELEAKLASSNEEHAALCTSITQLKAARAMQRKELDRITKDFADLRTEFQDLRLLSNSPAFFLSEAKETMQSLEQLRNTAQFEIKALESAFDNDGKLVLTQEARSTLDELRCELTKSHQVVDLLRDKLQAMASELAEARSRISELEGLTVDDAKTVERVTFHLQQSAEHVAAVTNFLQGQQRESVQAATEVYEMTQQLVQSNARLKEAEAQISSMRQQMAEHQETREDHKVQLRFLGNTNDFQERTNKELEMRLQNINEELRLALNHSHELEGRLDAVKGHESNLLQQNLGLRSEQDAMNEILGTAQRQLAEAHAREISISRQLTKVTAERDAGTEILKDMDILKRDLELYREKHVETSVAFKALQERFDEQSVALTATKEELGDAQERLHSTERRAGEIAMDITHLREQKGLLEARLQNALREMDAKTESLMTLRMEVSRKEGISETLLREEKQRADAALRQNMEMKSRIESLQAERDQKNHRIKDMERRLAEAGAPCTKHAQEVAALASRVSELETAKNELFTRATTITQRYARNDLNDDEKALVATVTKKVHGLHDREMVEKNNEIKRRDNLIKEHKARISQLEDNLVRRIHEVAPAETKVDSSLFSDMSPEPDLSYPADNRITNPLTVDPTTSAVKQTKVAPSMPPGHSSFTKLAKDEDGTEFEEEKPYTSTKRPLFTNNGNDPCATSRPTRRARHSKLVEPERTFDNASDATTKKKATKRR